MHLGFPNSVRSALSRLPGLSKEGKAFPAINRERQEKNKPTAVIADRGWRMFIKQGISFASFLAAVLVCASALAANQPDEITVTARKKTESAEDVPITMNVLSGDYLEKASIQDTADLQWSVPGLVVREDASGVQAYIRGVGTDVFPLGADNSTGVYVDGIYRGRGRDQWVEMYDLQRIEVLKGPQGTLYGRNTTGGALLYHSTRPDPSQFDAEFFAEAGSENLGRLGGFINIPLVDDEIAFRASVQRTKADGFTDNILDAPGTFDELDDRDTFSFRAALGWEGEKLSATLTADFWRDDRDQYSFKYDDRVPSTRAMFFPTEIPSDNFKVLVDTTPGFEVENWGLALNISYDINDRLQLTSITGYRDSMELQGVDIDGTEEDFGVVVLDEEGDSFQQEFLFNYESDDGRWSTTTGFFYYEDDGESTPDIQPNLLIRILAPSEVETKSWAIYGETTYRVNERWAVTGGLRYTDEEKDYVVGPFSISGTDDPPNFVEQPGMADDTADFDDWSPRLGFEYTPDDNTLVYGNLAKGFKSGGPKTSELPEDPDDQEFDPEELWSLELGTKRVFDGGRFIWSIAGFYYDYADLQVNVFPVGSAIATTENAADATIWGIDTDFSWVVTDAFDLSAALTVIPEAEFDEFFTDDPETPDPTVVNLKGNRIPRAPKRQLALAAQYVIDFEDSGELALRADYSYTSDIEYIVTNPEFAEQNSFSLINARATWTSDDGDLSVYIYGRNLTDEEYVGTITRNVQIGQLFTQNPPRNWGIGFTIGLGP